VDRRRFGQVIREDHADAIADAHVEGRAGNGAVVRPRLDHDAGRNEPRLDLGDDMEDLEFVGRDGRQIRKQRVIGLRLRLSGADDSR
jgi:hypothetical protein